MRKFNQIIFLCANVSKLSQKLFQLCTKSSFLFNAFFIQKRVDFLAMKKMSSSV